MRTSRPSSSRICSSAMRGALLVLADEWVSFAGRRQDRPCRRATWPACSGTVDDMPLTRLALAVAALLLAPAAAHADASWKVDSQYRQQATAPLECSTGLVSDPTTGSGGR